MGDSECKEKPEPQRADWRKKNEKDFATCIWSIAWKSSQWCLSSVCSLSSCCCLSICIIHQSALALCCLIQSLDPVPEVLIGKWCDSNPASDPPFPSLIPCCCPLLMSQPIERLVWRSKLTSRRLYTPVTLRYILYLHLWWCLQDEQGAQLPVCVLDGFHDRCNNSFNVINKKGGENRRLFSVLSLTVMNEGLQGAGQWKTA